MVSKSEQGLGSAEGLIASLQDSQERLQNELDLTKGRLKETKDALSNVEVMSLSYCNLNISEVKNMI